MLIPAPWPIDFNSNPKAYWAIMDGAYVRYRVNTEYNYEYDEWVATCPAFPLLSAGAPTPSKSIEELCMVMNMSVEIYKEEGWELPKQTTL